MFRTTPPTTARRSLEKHYHRYKQNYGAIRKCTEFFKVLPEEQQTRLTTAIITKENRPSIKHIAKFLYDLRSKFVHGGELVLQFGSAPMLIRRKELHPILVTPSMQDVSDVFERGLLVHFERK